MIEKMPLIPLRGLAVFCNENKKEYLERLIYECIDEKVEIISFKFPELPKNNIKIRGKIVDVLVKSKGEEVNIEINSYADDYLRRRNASYIFKMYSDAINSGESYDNK